jgi:hypothetical protein
MYKKGTRMNANELADELEKQSSGNSLISFSQLDQAATMLRKQQAELDSIIEKNKPEIEKVNAYIKALEDEIEALKEALQAVITISDRKHDAWDKAKELLK